jgi:hypothetical protein
LIFAWCTLPLMPYVPFGDESVIDPLNFVPVCFQ